MGNIPVIGKSPTGKDTRRSRLAEEVALHRVVESFRPEADRICYDPYAILFLGSDLRNYLDFCARNPEEAKKQAELMNRLFPGVRNSIIARTRYFDDAVREAACKGLEQLVILGAGYDTRAYRIEELRDRVKVFEADLPEIQEHKIEVIREIFGDLPRHVTYLPIDFEDKDSCQGLERTGYSPLKKTLFIMEGFVYYLPEGAVTAILSFIVHHSGHGSMILFDYLPESVVDGTCTVGVGRNMGARAAEYGEPFRFGVPDGTIRSFLEDLGYTRVHHLTCTDLTLRYFTGNNTCREVCDLFSFVSAEIS